MMANEQELSFTPNFAAKLFEKQFSDPSVKMNSKDISAQMCAELMKVFIAETALRAAQQVSCEDASVCEVEHVEKILPQLLLDF